MSDQYVWLTWVSALLIPWALLYWRFPAHRRAMWWSSVFTAPFGLTEPLFVPEYWNPPTLFDLAQRTGFDIESLIFCFGIGGVGSVLYNVLTRRGTTAVPTHERRHHRHRYHRQVLATPFVVFAALVWLPWNPIYPGIVAMLAGAVATWWCRPDLAGKTWIGGALFVAYYAAFLLGIELTVPGYIERVWNFESLTGWRLGFMPVEELLFALGFGMYWSGVYEHVTWRTPAV
ncbi:MAG: lycopene cyclase domain-containing protein [Gemmatimonadales bacterium]